MIEARSNTHASPKRLAPCTLHSMPKAIRIGALYTSLVLFLPGCSGAPGQAQRRGPEAGFCIPPSPRCFTGRRPRHTRVGDREISTTPAASGSLQKSPADCISPRATQVVNDISGTSTPRKHLGPTAEEIVAARKEEALQRKANVLNSWRCDLSEALIMLRASPRLDSVHLPHLVFVQPGPRVSRDRHRGLREACIRRSHGRQWRAAFRANLRRGPGNLAEEPSLSTSRCSGRWPRENWQGSQCFGQV